MYPWLTRVARVLVRLLGVSVLVTGAAMVVWLAASVLSSPTASAQTLPPPASGSSSSSSSPKHSTKTPTKTSTPASNRDAQNREAQDDEMYGPGATHRSATKKTTRKSSAADAPAARSSAAKPSAETLRENANARASHNPAVAQEIADSARAAASKKAAAERKTPRYQKLVNDANARASHTPPIAQQMQQASDQARKVAAAKQDQALVRATMLPTTVLFPNDPVTKAPSTPSPYPALFAREDAEARQRKQKAEQAAKSEAAREAVIDKWLAHHPYATAVLDADSTDYSTPNRVTDTGFNSEDTKDYQFTNGWVNQENDVCNPGGGQFGSATDEENCAQLYAHHNPRFAAGSPIASLKSDVARSNAPKAVKELFKEGLPSLAERTENVADLQVTTREAHLLELYEIPEK